MNAHRAAVRTAPARRMLEHYPHTHTKLIKAEIKETQEQKVNGAVDQTALKPLREFETITAFQSSYCCLVTTTTDKRKTARKHNIANTRETAPNNQKSK